jgi:hypothetical protein
MIFLSSSTLICLFSTQWGQSSPANCFFSLLLLLSLLSYKLVALAPHVATLAQRRMKQPVSWNIPLAMYRAEEFGGRCKGISCMRGFVVQVRWTLEVELFCFKPSEPTEFLIYGWLGWQKPMDLCFFDGENSPHTLFLSIAGYWFLIWSALCYLCPYLERVVRDLRALQMKFYITSWLLCIVGMRYLLCLHSHSITDDEGCMYTDWWRA